MLFPFVQLIGTTEVYSLTLGHFETSWKTDKERLLEQMPLLGLIRCKGFFSFCKRGNCIKCPIYFQAFLNASQIFIMSTVSTTVIVSSPLVTDNSTNLTSVEEGATAWHTFVEIVLLGIISVFGLVGNLFVMRNAVADITRFAQQNVVLFFSLALGDLVVSVLRGPILIYILIQHDGDEQDVLCQVWMVSTMFVAVALFTNTVLAIQRIFIMFCYSKYKKVFTFKNMLVVAVSVWIFFPTANITIYKLFQQDAFFKVSHHVCVLVYSTENLQPDHFTLIRSLLVCALGYVPICLTAICYYLINARIKKSGLKKLDKIIVNLNFSRVILLSGVRVALTLSLLTPFFLMLILAPVYPGPLLPCMRYFDYLLVLYSAISPIITLNDADFKDSKCRRAWLSAHFGGTGMFQRKEIDDKQEQAYSICITSADLKCYKVTE